MPRLKVSLRGAQISDIGLSSEREYIGGRKETCDILLQPEKGISREHFKLKFEDGKWTISSLSRFGEIFSQGQRVESFNLEHGLTFQIPPYEFQFSDLPDAIADGVKDQAAIEVNENERTVIGASQQVPYVKMLNSKGQVREMLRLEVGDLWVSGRDPSCQIVIPDQRVSRRQFELRKINGIYTVLDLGSVNGTFLNGVPISSVDPVPLKSGDAISVLDNMMYFELHDPNFKYKMDRIEVPPLQLVQNDEEVVNFENIQPSDQGMALQEVDQPYVDPQMQQQYYDPNGGPFTGMPSSMSNPDENQYYTFQPPQEQKPLSTWEKFKSNKPLVIAAVLLFLGGAYYLSELMNAPSEIPKNAQNTQDPFSRLKPEEQKTVQDLYALAEKSMLQQKYSLAKENLDKIHQLLPTGYKDSLAIREEADVNEQTIISQQQQERLEKEKAEQERKILETAEQCRKLVNPELTIEKMKECLAPIALIDPTNSQYITLMGEAERIESDKRRKADDQLAHESQIKALEDLFAKAEKIQSQGFPYKAIKAYKSVIAAGLPDPQNLKDKAQSRIKFIERKIASKTDDNLKKADQLLQDGKLRDAILSMRAALVYDPENKTLKDKIEKNTEDLRRQMMSIYQESIIDENFSNIDGSETRQGAKDKWKKIVETDLDDGEYYRKAFIKLRKYGML